MYSVNRLHQEHMDENLCPYSDSLMSRIIYTINQNHHNIGFLSYVNSPNPDGQVTMMSCKSLIQCQPLKELFDRLIISSHHDLFRTIRSESIFR